MPRVRFGGRRRARFGGRRVQLFPVLIVSFVILLMAQTTTTHRLPPADPFDRSHTIPRADPMLPRGHPPTEPSADPMLPRGHPPTEPSVDPMLPRGHPPTEPYVQAPSHQEPPPPCAPEPAHDMPLWVQWIGFAFTSISGLRDLAFIISELWRILKIMSIMSYLWKILQCIYMLACAYLHMWWGCCVPGLSLPTVL